MDRNNNSVKKNIFNYKNIIYVIIILIILSIIIYLTVTLINYYKINCYEKKGVFQYLTDFSNNDVCLQKNAPIPQKPKELPPVQNKINLIPNFEPKKEVYHIANQDYTYDQSKCKCESYGGRLATKPEVIDAYNKGANWCSYGWTEKQAAYYPVQKCEWDKIQKENERLPNNAKKYCGLPGINGGYFANPDIRFGINCYGVKPKGELNKPKTPYCPPMNFCKLDTNYEASHKLDTDEITPFNDEKWSMDIN